MTTTVAKLQAIVTADTKAAESALDRTSAKLNETGKAAESAKARFSGFEQASGMLAGPLAAIGAAGAAAAGGMLLAAGRAEQTQVAFTTMLGSAEEATSYLAELRQFANATPFEYEDLTQATQKLLAFGFAAEDVIPMLTDVGDAAAGLGAGQEGIDRITRALGQMSARGQVTAQEMMQLTEVGIPAWQYLADAVGATTGEVQDMVTKGLIPASVGIDAIRKGMQGDFGGLMAKQAETLNGKLSTLSDTTKTFAAELGETLKPAAVAAVDGLQGLVDALAALSGEEKNSALTIGGTVTAIAGLSGAALTAGPALVNFGKALSTMTGLAQGSALAMGAAGGAVALALGAWAVAAGMAVDVGRKWAAGLSAVDAALVQHERDMRASAASYDEYISEMTRALETAGKLDAGTRASVTGFLELADATGMTAEELAGLANANAGLTEAQLTELVIAGQLTEAQANAINQYRAGAGAVDALTAKYGLLGAAQFQQAQNELIAARQMDAYNQVLGDAGEMLAGLQVGATQAGEAIAGLKADPAPFTAIGDALGDLSAAFSGQVGQEIDGFTQKQADLRDRMGEVQAKIDALQGKSYRTPAQEQELSSLKAQLGDLNGALGENATAHEDAMKRIAFSMLQAKLAADGWQVGELEMLSAVGVAWGVLDQQTSNMLNGVSAAMTAAGGDAEKFMQIMGGIYALPDKEINIRVNTQSVNYETTLAATAGENFGGWTPSTTTGTGASPAPRPTPTDTIIDGMRAAGGPVWPGGTFLVGERGPELFTPTAPGMITPGGATSTTWNGNIVINGAGDAQATAQAVLKALKDRGLIPAVSLR